MKFTHSLPAIEPMQTEKLHNPRSEKYGIDRARKSVETVSDLFSLEQKIGQMHESFVSACNNIEQNVHSFANTSRTPENPLEDESTGFEEEKKRWKSEQAELMKRLSEKDEENKRLRQEGKEMEEAVLTMRSKFETIANNLINKIKPIETAPDTSTNIIPDLSPSSEEIEEDIVLAKKGDDSK